MSQRIRLVTISRAACGAVLFAFLAASSACDKDNILAPTGAELTLVTTANTVAANGSLEVTAYLFRGQFGEDGVTTGGGPPVRNDTIVTFVSTLGRFEPAEAKTVDGKVTVRFVGDGRAGAATLTAFSGAAVGELDITITAAGDTAR
jgi:hypothetical protein